MWRLLEQWTLERAGCVLLLFLTVQKQSVQVSLLESIPETYQWTLSLWKWMSQGVLWGPELKRTDLYVDNTLQSLGGLKLTSEWFSCLCRNLVYFPGEDLIAVTVAGRMQGYMVFWSVAIVLVLLWSGLSRLHERSFIGGLIIYLEPMPKAERWTPPLRRAVRCRGEMHFSSSVLLLWIKAQSEISFVKLV